MVNGCVQGGFSTGMLIRHPPVFHKSVKVDVSLRFWWAQEGWPLRGPRATLKCQHGDDYLCLYRRAAGHLQQMEARSSDGAGLRGEHTDHQTERRTWERNPWSAALRRRRSRKFWQRMGTSGGPHRETTGTNPPPSHSCAPSCTSSGGSGTRSLPGGRWAAARRPFPASGVDTSKGCSGTPSPAPAAGCW